MDSSIVLVLLGPTASGKTKALEDLNLDPKLFEIISCDSRQIYKELEISTAAPSLKFRNIIKHHFISTLEPNQNFTAGEFVKEANIIINNIHEKNKIPIIVGGSIFYYNAIRTGMLPIHNLNQNKDEKTKYLEKLTIEERLNLLKKLDPEIISVTVNKNNEKIKYIHENDSYRIFRALEIILCTNKKLSDINKENINSLKKTNLNFKGFYFEVEKNFHKKLIEERVKIMIEEGIVEEVAKVYNKYGLCKILKNYGNERGIGCVFR